MLNAFTVDVEDYFQVSAFASNVDPNQWEKYPSRVVNNTREMLNLLEKHRVKATFFILGWVAERYPEIVREICQAGHELGSHGYWHQLVYKQTPDEFRADLRRSREVLHRAVDTPILAYRAPSFSITQKSLWALDILTEEKFLYDSSIFPIHHDRYGIPNSPCHPHAIERQAGRLWELPPAVLRLGRWNLPVGGGGYFRLYPARFSRFCLDTINHREKRPCTFYIHPWELDPEQPRLPCSTWTRWRHYVNLPHTKHKLHYLLSHIPFAPLSTMLAEYQQSTGGNS